MAKKRVPKITTFLKKVVDTSDKEGFKLGAKDSNKKNIRILPKKLQFNTQELQGIRDNFFVPTDLRIDRKQSLDMSRLSDIHLNEVYKQIRNNVIDYEKITKLEPKIEQAEIIVIPSILSPSSFKNERLTFKFKEDLDEKFSVDLQEEILEIINSHVNVDLNLNNRLRKWVKDALFIYGSKPIMILPSETITNIRNSSISFEDLEDPTRFPNNILDSLDNLDFNDIKIDEKSEKIKDITSDLISNISEEILDKYPTSLIEKILSTTSTSILNGSLEAMTSTIKKKKIVEITDKLEFLGYGISKNNLTTKNIVKKYNQIYNQTNGDSEPEDTSITFTKDPFINVVEYIGNSKDSKYHPVMIELPAESVLPIFVLSDPSEHVGYLVFLDENGYPISYNPDITDTKLQTKMSETFDRYDNNRHLIDNVFKSSSYSTNVFKKSIKNLFSNYEIKSKMISKTYELLLDNVINNVIKSSGFVNVDYKLQNELITNMLYRTLHHKKTKILFVPSFMMCYLAFKYNHRGVGVSKIEELAFPLSLKVTYLITKMFRMIDQAIVNKNVKINLNEHVNEPINLLYKIKSLLLMNKAIDFSYDPIKIIKSLTDRQYSFVIDNLPGVNQFSVESDNVSKSLESPDDNLNEIIEKLITIILEVPPSAYNELSENEYSRSLVTINMLFSLRMNSRRKIVIEKISNLLKQYLYFDPIIKEEIDSILKSKLSRSKISDAKRRGLISYLINQLYLYIPEPRIVFDKSEFEQANEYVNFIDSLVEKLYPSDLINDRDSQDTLNSIVSFVKSKLLRKFLTQTDLIVGTDKLFSNLDDIDVNEVMEIERIVQNYKSAITKYYEKIKPSEEGSQNKNW